MHYLEPIGLTLWQSSSNIFLKKLILKKKVSRWQQKHEILPYDFEISYMDTSWVIFFGFVWIISLCGIMALLKGQNEIK